MNKHLIPILDPIQTKDLEQYNIAKQQIKSWDLMERAANLFADWFINSFPNEDQKIAIFCGSGNNGGDGLAIARLLSEQFRLIDVFICSQNQSFSEDNLRNQALLNDFQVDFTSLSEQDPLPNLGKYTFIIDAIFGIGLNRPLEGFYLKLIEHLNDSESTVIAVDIPSGLFAHQHSPSQIGKVNANFTLSFGFPKLAFLFPENEKAVGNWLIKDLDFDKDSYKDFDITTYYLDRLFIKSLVQRRAKFSHKGNFGHALLIGGSYGKIGAALLAGEACLRSGCGLLTVHIPKIGYNIIQSKFPEAMVSIDRHEHYFSECPELDAYTTIGLGCGLGQNSHIEKALKTVLENAKTPIVIDADALNLIAKNNWLNLIPKNAILTPHVKEFERLFGKSENDFERHKLQIANAKKYSIIIILKGANTCIVSPYGVSYFNSTGNPGMATAGTGDALCGIITGLLAQSYTPINAALIGTFLHGLAGDLAAKKQGSESLIASDLIKNLGQAFKQLN